VRTIQHLLPLALAGAVAALSVLAAETQVQLLSGTGPDDAVEWDFFCTDGRNSRVWSTIRVPSCWEQQGFGTYNYGGSLQHNTGDLVGNEQGLYRRTFTVPAEWQGRVVRLVFDGSMTDTSVWINGQSAGPTHQGAFYRFHYDVTSLLRFGAENLIEVTVAKNSSNRSVNDAERAADYWVFGGIFRPVWLESLPPQFIDWTAIDARADGSFAAHVHLGAPAAAAGELRAQILDMQDRPVGAPLAASLAAGDTSATVRGQCDGVKLWTAETPHLYRVRFELAVVGPDLWSAPGSPAAGKEARARGAALQDQAAAPAVAHTTTERFGFRTIEVRENDGVYLNGTKITLKGVNRHCFWPETGRTVSREQSYTDARLIKGANMNAVRMSHYPPDKHFLEACDELGLYVLDELAGWQKPYDIPTGARLIGQLVRRDVNHPSILMWDNGNEGGWKAENDAEFAKWDPQRRAVLHPWAINSGINTDHYEKYASTVKLSAGPQIFMPTEFLHGLYDGGIGAGFRDYWDVMGKSPTVAGGFFWVWADEGIVRTDQNGRIDNAGNLAPDGMVGPHRELEGSYFAVKEIWSPVQIRTPDPAYITPEILKKLPVENRYDFTSLDRCAFRWRLLRSSVPQHSRGAMQVQELARGEARASAIPPHASGSVAFDLPPPEVNGWQIVQITAVGPDGSELATSSWRYARSDNLPMRGWSHRGIPDTPVEIREDATTLRVGRLQFDRISGRLRGVELVPGSLIPIAGPNLVAFQREGKRYVAVTPDAVRQTFGCRREDLDVVVEAKFSGSLRAVTWFVRPEGPVALNCEYSLDSDVDILGIAFDYPEANVKSKRWFGRGPYRVYRNRMEGGVLDLHEVAFNDPIPGQSFTYSEFKGYFRDWQWVQLETTEGTISIENASGVPFLGLYAPRDGVPSMLAFPDTGIAFLEVIPAIGTKFDSPDQLGPQSQTPHVSGERTISVTFRFTPPASTKP
jgi:hypothetical protein